MGDDSSLDDLRRSATHVLLSEGDELLLDADRIPLDDDVQHHLDRVVRLRDGDVVSVTAGVGRWRLAVWRSDRTLEAVGPVVASTIPSGFVLAVAMPKGDRLDLIVQKATDLGVARIALLPAEHSVVRWRPERAPRQLQRLQRVADEATRQSRRVTRTVIEAPRPALEVIAGAAVAEPGGVPIVGEEPMVCVGPEGGWRDDELAVAGSTIGMGDTILRVETAAIAACTLRLLRRGAGL